MLSLKDAEKEYKRGGAAQATGDARCFMYAELLRDAHGGEVSKYYAYLSRAGSDEALYAAVKELLDSRALAWDVLMSEHDRLSAFKGHTAIG